MDIKEASDEIEKYRFIIGKKIDKQEISKLIITPSNGKNRSEIITAVHYDGDYTLYLTNEKDFQIEILFDLEDFSNTGILFTTTLDDALKRLKIMK